MSGGVWPRSQWDHDGGVRWSPGTLAARLSGLNVISFLSSFSNVPLNVLRAGNKNEKVIFLIHR